jgi:hypothetical protein
VRWIRDLLAVVVMLVLSGCGGGSDGEPSAEPSRSLPTDGKVAGWPPPEVLDLPHANEPNVDGGGERSVRAWVAYAAGEIGYGLRTTFLELDEPEDCLVCREIGDQVRAAREGRHRYEFDEEWSARVLAVKRLDLGTSLPAWAALVELTQPEMRRIDDTGTVTETLPGRTRRTELVLRAGGHEWSIESWREVAGQATA